jgi:hypothetical protein
MIGHVLKGLRSAEEKLEEKKKSCIYRIRRNKGFHAL